MFALDISQHQGAGDAVQHVGGRRAAAPLFKPCVPGGADVGALRHLFAAQARGAAALRGKAEGRRIELCSPIFQIGAEPVVVGDALVHGVSHYTRIIVTTLPG